eukprot:EG_transcript_13368
MGLIEEARTCRFCLEPGPPDPGAGEAGEGEEDAVIAPCRCEGSSKWVHVRCLQRWQCEVYDARARVCQVCRAPFSLQPSASRPSILRTTPTNTNYDRSAAQALCPTRVAALLALMQPGHVIVQTPTQAERARLELASPRVAPDTLLDVLQAVLRSRLQHWHRGVFLIVHREPQRALDQTDIIVAVNVTRHVPDPPTSEAASLAARPAVRTRFLNGGPCGTDRPLCVLALQLVDATSDPAFPAPPTNVFRLGADPSPNAPAARTRQTGDGAVPPPASHPAAAEPDPGMEGAAAPPDGAARPLAVYAGEVGAVLPWLAALEEGPARYEVDALWVTGYAVWSTQQLLCEVARGSWGLCAADPRAVLPGRPGLWDALWRAGAPLTAGLTPRGPGGPTPGEAAPAAEGDPPAS